MCEFLTLPKTLGAQQKTNHPFEKWMVKGKDPGFLLGSFGPIFSCELVVDFGSFTSWNLGQQRSLWGIHMFHIVSCDIHTNYRIPQWSCNILKNTHGNHQSCLADMNGMFLVGLCWKKLNMAGSTAKNGLQLGWLSSKSPEHGPFLVYVANPTGFLRVLNLERYTCSEMFSWK